MNFGKYHFTFRYQQHDSHLSENADKYARSIDSSEQFLLFIPRVIISVLFILCTLEPARENKVHEQLSMCPINNSRRNRKAPLLPEEIGIKDNEAYS